MSAKVRKMSPEDVAVQGILDLLHVEKARLGLTDADLKAWRPPADAAPPAAQGEGTADSKAAGR